MVLKNGNYVFLVVCSLVRSGSASEPPNWCHFMEDKTRFFYWNKTELSSLEYLLSFCGLRCNKSERVDVSQVRSFYDCLECHCQRPACEFYDNCCPDISVPLPKQAIKYGNVNNWVTPLQRDWNDSKSYEDRTSSEYLIPGNSGCFRKGKPFSYVQKCQPDYKGNSTVKQLCEYNLPPNMQTFKTYIKVVDNSTGVVYRNVYCSQCSGVNQTKSLITTLHSRDYLYSYAATTVEKLLQSQVQHQKFRKDVVVLDSSTGDVLECLYQQRVVTNPCPGYSPDTDKDIVEACHSMSHPRYIVRDHETREFVQNIFCSICLKAKYPRVATLKKCTKTQNDFNLSALPDTPLALALNDLPEASPTNTNDETECNPLATLRLGTFWADSQGRCIPTQCAPGKQHKGRNCVEIIKEVTDLVYNVQVWYVIDKRDNLAQWVRLNEIYTLKNYLELFSLQLELELLELTSYYNIDVAIIAERSSCYGFTVYDNHVAVLWVNAIVKGPNSTPRTDFETNLLKKLLKKNLILRMPTNQVIVAKPQAIFQGSIFAKVQLNTLFGHIFFKEKAKSYWVKERGTTLKILFVHSFKNCMLILRCIEPSTRPIYQELESDRNHYLNMNQLLVCQFISLNQSDYEMAINDTVIPPMVKITLKFRATQINITDNDNLFMVDVDDNGRLDVCIDLIDRKLKERKLRIKKEHN